MARFRGAKGQFSPRPAAPHVPALRDQGLRGFMMDTLTPGIARYGVELSAEINLLMYRMSLEMELWAKEHAPWRNRTWDARTGLTASMDESITTPTIYLYHTVHYGVWLEIRWDGQYAIIQPTIEHFGPRLMREIQAVIL